MSELELLLSLGFGVLLLVWAGLVLYVLATRALDDGRRALLAGTRRAATRRVRRRLGPGGLDVVRRVPRRMLETVASDGTAEPSLAAACARRLVATDPERYRQAAADTRPRVRLRRIAALRILAVGGSPHALTLLRDALSSPDPAVAGSAVAELGSLPSLVAAQVLVDALRRERCPRSWVATRLDGFPLPVGELIEPLLADAEPAVRYRGAKLLARYAETPGLAERLAPLTADDDARVRAAAAETLGAVGGEVAVEALGALLQDPVPFVRLHAARALGVLPDPRVADGITPLPGDEQWWVRPAAERAPARLGDGARDVVVEYLDAPDRLARNGAAEVLQNGGTPDEPLGRVGSGADGDDADLLRRILAAGESSFAELAVARLDPDGRDRVRDAAPAEHA